ncbi:MAG: hypothetical protein JRJ12_10710 [Deltaproteobacteria bacterium]|nr:hypothetical protein [Deltaproteobacteria bacterium]MBW2071835.1 hypothetical protein [Deltaproteobacteria bacterium]
MNKWVKSALFFVGIGLVGSLGYIPWNYAFTYESCTVDFSPLFRSHTYTPVGSVLKILAILIWILGGLFLIGLAYERWSLRRGK